MKQTGGATCHTSDFSIESREREQKLIPRRMCKEKHNSLEMGKQGAGTTVTHIARMCDIPHDQGRHSSRERERSGG